MVNKPSDCFENLVIVIFLRFARSVKLALWHAQGMIAAFDHVQSVRCFHLSPDAFQKVQRTQRVTRALHKQNGCSQSAQNFVTKSCAR